MLNLHSCVPLLPHVKFTSRVVAVRYHSISAHRGPGWQVDKETHIVQAPRYGAEIFSYIYIVGGAVAAARIAMAKEVPQPRGELDNSIDEAAHCRLVAMVQSD